MLLLIIIPLFFPSPERTCAINLNHVADSIQKQRSASMNEFEVFHDSSCNTWRVVGAGIQRFVQMTNWKYVLSSINAFLLVLELLQLHSSHPYLMLIACLIYCCWSHPQMMNIGIVSGSFSYLLSYLLCYAFCCTRGSKNWGKTYVLVGGTDD